MSNCVNRCDRCGRKFDARPRRKLAMLQEQRRGTNFSTSGFARYYCEECAEEAKKAIGRFEGEVRR